MSKARDLAGLFNLGPRSGTTAQRPATADVGDIYYNGTTGKTEIYTTTGWKEMASGIPFGADAGRPASPTLGQPYFNGEAQRLELYTAAGWNNIIQEVPGVSGIQGNYSEATNSGTFTIIGTNFASGAIASAIGTNGSEVVASSTTFNSLVQLTATFTGLSNANEPYNIKVLNTSNLFGILPNALYVNATPVWQTASGSLGTFDELVSVSISATATDSDSTISYALASGSTLPSGVTLNSSTGLISGTLPNVTANTTYSFTVNASDGINPVVPRTFSISSLRNLTLEYLIVGGGGAGGDFFSGSGYNAAGGGGGAGGYIYQAPTTLKASSFSFPITVGSAGVSTATSNTSGGYSTSGGNSSFNNIIAYGGGRGGAGNSSSSPNAYVAGSGGSGGGGVRPDAGSSFANGGSGTASQGNSGGSQVSGDGDGGGGGGAASAGTSGGSGSQGGTGSISSITGSSVYYSAGGGGGRGASGGWVSNNGGAGGGGVGGAKTNNAFGTNASTYGSGGGGAGASAGDNGIFAKGGNGGSGVVIVAYPDTEQALTIPGTLTYDQPTRSGYRVYRFTAGTGTVTL
jgi:hypothetical protein